MARKATHLQTCAVKDIVIVYRLPPQELHNTQLQVHVQISAGFHVFNFTQHITAPSIAFQSSQFRGSSVCTAPRTAPGSAKGSQTHSIQCSMLIAQHPAGWLGAPRLPGFPVAQHPVEHPTPPRFRG